MRRLKAADDCNTGREHLLSVALSVALSRCTLSSQNSFLS